MMYSRSLFHYFLLIVAAIIFIPAVIIGSIGAQRLTSIRNEQKLYLGTTCLVINITEETLPSDCDCDGCHQTTCYAEHFAVLYTIENGTSLYGMIDINEISYRPQIAVSKVKWSEFSIRDSSVCLFIQVNRTYSCFYDRTNVKRVQWSKPSERSALTMLIVGFTITGVVLLSVLIGEMICFITERRREKNEHNRF